MAGRGQMVSKSSGRKSKSTRAEIKGKRNEIQIRRNEIQGHFPSADPAFSTT
jgi:hypothetical protein